jgi:Iron/manganese superoxide dismutases, C-terminal domain
MTLQEMANVAGFEPVLVMDVWEHELLLDYQAAQRAKYIEAVSQTLDGRQSKVGLQPGHFHDRQIRCSRIHVNLQGGSSSGCIHPLSSLSAPDSTSDNLVGDFLAPSRKAEPCRTYCLANWRDRGRSRAHCLSLWLSYLLLFAHA